MAVKKKKLTKAQITHGALHEKQAIDLLREHKEKQEKGAIVLPQVRNGTGHTRTIRTADALICETWSSRGIGFTGVEYKRSRSDWLSELKNPVKAEEIGKFCKYWVILAPAGLIEIDEVPELWGLWEIHDNKYIKSRMRAPMRKYREPSIEFVCSILRANRQYDPAAQHDWNVEMRIRKRIEEEFQARFDRVSNDHKELQKTIHEFERRTGLNMRWNIEGTIELVPRMLEYLKDPEQFERRLDRQRDELVSMVETIDTIRSDSE